MTLEGHSFEYIERMGTGTGDMIRQCVAAGLPEPEFSLSEGFTTTIRRPVSDPVERLILVIEHEELSAVSICDHLGLKHRPSFRENYLNPALGKGLIGYAIPDKPRSPLQKHWLTDKRREVLEQFKGRGKSG